jgi:hypothetical protein
MLQAVTQIRQGYPSMAIGYSETGLRMAEEGIWKDFADVVVIDLRKECKEIKNRRRYILAASCNIIHHKII